MTHLTPKNVEIGQPEEHPDIQVEPVVDPVPRDVPKKAPNPIKTPERELVPA